MATRRALVLILCGTLGLAVAMPEREAEARPRRARKARKARKAPRKVSAEEAAKILQRKLFKEGQEHFVAGRYAEAAEAFKKAFDAVPHRSIQVNIAMAFASTGDNVQAHNHLMIYNKMKLPSDPPLPEVLQKLPLKIGSIVVRVPDPLAGIFVDGQLKGHTEVIMYFEPSKRVVDVRLDDRIVSTRVIDVKGGQEHIWEVTKQMMEAAKPRPVEIAPPPRREVVIPPVRTPTDQDEGKSRLGRLHWGYFSAVAALAVAAAGAAAYTSFKNLQIHNEFAKDPWNKDLQQEGILYQNTANGLWGATAAAATTAVLLAIFTRWKAKKPKESAATVSVTPWATPGNLGLSVSVTGE